jgi:hypothetical protein
VITDLLINSNIIYYQNLEPNSFLERYWTFFLDSLIELLLFSLLLVLILLLDEFFVNFYSFKS